MIQPLSPGNIPFDSSALHTAAVVDSGTSVKDNDPVEVFGSQDTEKNDELIPVKLQLQPTNVEPEQTVMVSKNRLGEIFRQDRFLVADDQGVGFSEGEIREILDGKGSTYNAKLNICIHTSDILNTYEHDLGIPLEFPTKIYHHYKSETDYARQQLERSDLDENIREKLSDFVNDLSRKTNRDDDKKVFLNLASSEESRMPCFNPGTMTITMAPYPGKHRHLTMEPARDTDTVAHETGHLANATIRPGWDESKYNFDSDFETCALREAVADLTSLFHTLKTRYTCEKVIEETGGNLLKSNRSSRVSENEGSDILFNYFKSNGTPNEERFLRDMVNDYKYIPRSEAARRQIGRQNVGQLFNNVYSYSQIFSGALYDAMAGIYENLTQKNPDKAGCLSDAAETTRKLMAKSLELAPWWRPDLKSLAQCVLQADIMENGGANQDALKKAFMERQILNLEDVADAEAHLKNTPELTLKDIPEGKDAAVKYLTEKGLLFSGEDISYNPERTYKNEKGETFVVYTMEKPYTGTTENTPFDLSTAVTAEICDLTPDLSMRSSLVMKFDNNGNLAYTRSEPFALFDRSQLLLKLIRNPQG